MCNSINFLHRVGGLLRLLLLVIMLLHLELRLTHKLLENVGVVAVPWLPAELPPFPINGVAASN